MKIFLILVLSLISFNSFSQNDRKNLGYIILGGGVSLSTASVLTPLEWTRDSNGLGYTKPLHENPAHLAGLISGVGVSFGGVITLMSSSKSGKPRRRK